MTCDALLGWLACSVCQTQETKKEHASSQQISNGQGRKKYRNKIKPNETSLQTGEGSQKTKNEQANTKTFQNKANTTKQPTNK